MIPERRPGLLLYRIGVKAAFIGSMPGVFGPRREAERSQTDQTEQGQETTMREPGVAARIHCAAARLGSKEGAERVAVHNEAALA